MKIFLACPTYIVRIIKGLRKQVTMKTVWRLNVAIIFTSRPWRRFSKTLSRVKIFENGGSAYWCGRAKTEVFENTCRRGLTQFKMWNSHRLSFPQIYYCERWDLFDTVTRILEKKNSEFTNLNRNWTYGCQDSKTWCVHFISLHKQLPQNRDDEYISHRNTVKFTFNRLVAERKWQTASPGLTEPKIEPERSVG